MKVRPSPWEFAPRRLRAATPAPQQGEEPQDAQSRLRAEHPWMSRSVEVLESAAWVAHTQSLNPPWGGASGALSAVTAAAAGAWGINKLARAQTALDAVEGVGHLALAVDNSLNAWQQFRPQSAAPAALSTGVGALAAGSELFLGGADLARGLREKDRLRTWVGASQLLSGAALATSLAFPGATGLAQAIALMSLTTRQSIYGFNTPSA